jgi:hypothetical protein
MKLTIASCDKKSIPPFVENTKAKPSNIESCTPKVPRQKQIHTPNGINLLSPTNPVVHSPSSSYHHLDYSQYTNSNSAVLRTHATPSSSGVASTNFLINPNALHGNAFVGMDSLESTYASVLANGGGVGTPLASPNRSTGSGRRNHNSGNANSNQHHQNHGNGGSNMQQQNTRGYNNNNNSNNNNRRNSHSSNHPYAHQYPDYQDYMIMATSSTDGSGGNGHVYPRNHANRAYSDDVLIRRGTEQFIRSKNNYSPESFGSVQSTGNASGGSGGVNMHSGSGNNGESYAVYARYDNYHNNSNNNNRDRDGYRENNHAPNKMYPRKSNALQQQQQQQQQQQSQHHHQQQQSMFHSPNRPHGASYRSNSMGSMNGYYYTIPANGGGMEGNDFVMHPSGSGNRNRPIPPPHSMHPNMVPHPHSMPIYAPIPGRRHANPQTHGMNIPSGGGAGTGHGNNNNYSSDNKYSSDVEYEYADHMPPNHNHHMHSHHPNHMTGAPIPPAPYMDIPNHPPAPSTNHHVFPQIPFGSGIPNNPNSIPNSNSAPVSTLPSSSSVSHEVESERSSVESNEYTSYPEEEHYPATAAHSHPYPHSHSNASSTHSTISAPTSQAPHQQPAVKYGGVKKL